jgi:hypothetical protein
MRNASPRRAWSGETGRDFAPWQPGARAGEEFREVRNAGQVAHRRTQVRKNGDGKGKAQTRIPAVGRLDAATLRGALQRTIRPLMELRLERATKRATRGAIGP